MYYTPSICTDYTRLMESILFHLQISLMLMIQLSHFLLL